MPLPATEAAKASSSPLLHYECTGHDSDKFLFHVLILDIQWLEHTWPAPCLFVEQRDAGPVRGRGSAAALAARGGRGDPEALTRTLDGPQHGASLGPFAFLAKVSSRLERARPCFLRV